MITHLVGLSLAPNSTVESGVAVREVISGKLIYLDKLFSMHDISMFFQNYPSLKTSIVCISLPWDNTMLDGKWRVQSKSYQMINTLGNFPNIDNWTKRFSTRGCDFINNLKEQNDNIFRFEIYLSRQRLNLYSNFKERSPADCKFLQSTLRNEFEMYELPQNMLPVAQLEAVIGTILAEEYLKNNTKSIFNFNNVDVINLF